MAAAPSKLRAALLPGALIGLVAAGVAALRAGAPEVLELTLHDARAEVSAERHPASTDVVLVAVDEETVRLAGGVHPLPRGALAAIVDEARRAGARVVALDYILEDPLEGAMASENAELERAIGDGVVVVGAAIPARPASGEAVEGPGAGDPRVEAVRLRHALHLADPPGSERFALSPPLPRFALAAAAIGGVSQRQEANGHVYALRHVYPTDDGAYLSLPLAAAWLYRGRPPLAIEGGVLRLGPVAAPLTEDGRVYLRWYGRPDPKGEGSPYPEVSAAALLRARLARDGEGRPPAAAELAPLQGRIAVVCPTLAGTKDKQPTPVNAAAVGGEIVANGIDDLLRGEFVERLPRWADAAVAFALSVAAALLATLVAGLSLPPWAVLGGSVAAGAALVGGYWLASIAALGRGLWLPALAPMVGALLAAFVADLRLFGLEKRDRRFIHDALGRYTSPALVDALLARRELLDRFGGTRQDLTVYFSDIRGFTSFSEGMAPEQLVELLNGYLSELTEIVEKHGGYVDKYIGDAIMAVWGAPVPAADHAVRACRAAIEMRDRIAALRPAWRERYGVAIHAGAGVNTGPMVAGNVGSRRKTNYTVLGDAVNLASRLEGANKVYGTSILIGEGTRAAAGHAIAARSVDLLQVKGKQHGVAVHELVGMTGEVPVAVEDRLARWEAAMADYRRGRFAEALAAFEELAGEDAGDPVAALYVARCRELAVAPPEPAWSGVHVMHDK